MKFRAIDLETASLASNALIWQIGFCDYRIERRTRGFDFRYEDHGLFFMTRPLHNRAHDPDTEKWMQDSGTLALFQKWQRNVNNREISLPLTDWVRIWNWMKDAANDNRHFVVNWTGADGTWLKTMFESLGLREPWKHRTLHCLGTMRGMFDASGFDVPLSSYRQSDADLTEEIMKPGSLIIGDNAGRWLKEQPFVFEGPKHGIDGAHMADHDAVYQARWHHQIMNAMWK